MIVDTSAILAILFKYGRGFDRESFEKVVARRKELFGDVPLPGDSADLIREAREIREAEIQNREGGNCKPT